LKPARLDKLTRNPAYPELKLDRVEEKIEEGKTW
jgi:hypothetical protein